jgi:hypothetical protein
VALLTLESTTAPEVLSQEETANMDMSKEFIKDYLSEILVPTLEEPVATVYAELKNLSNILDEPDSLSNKAKDTAFADKCMHLESQTLSLIDVLESSNQFPGCDILLAFAMAAMLFQVSYPIQYSYLYFHS